MTIIDIRNYFAEQYLAKNFITDKSGSCTLELLGASFCADSPSIFGEINQQYIEHELQWYLSESLYVKDIPVKVPKIWQDVASKNGKINSNYGYLIFNADNHLQYRSVLAELVRSQYSRRAIMIYTRPTMHTDYCTDGMSDFVCTNAVQYLIRDSALHVVVQMRSNDAWAGYRNDYAWQRFVQESLVYRYNSENPSLKPIVSGNITWQVGSLHVYENQFYLIDHYIKSNRLEFSISKSQYKSLYAIK